VRDWLWQSFSSRTQNVLCALRSAFELYQVDGTLDLVFGLRWATTFKLGHDIVFDMVHFYGFCGHRVVGWDDGQKAQAISSCISCTQHMVRIVLPEYNRSMWCMGVVGMHVIFWHDPNSLEQVYEYQTIPKNQHILNRANSADRHE
jgi:hypothetical protein